MLPSLLAAVLAASPELLAAEAVAARGLSRVGLAVSAEEVFEVSPAPLTAGRGSTPDELRRALVQLGVDPTAGGSGAPARQWPRLKQVLSAGHPALVHLGETPALAVGLDGARILLEAGDLPVERFRARWTGDWVGLIVVAPPRRPAPESPSRAEVARRAAALRTRHPRLTLDWDRPFLIIGDEPPRVVERRTGLVRWTRRLLLRDFFERTPDRLEELWILGDEGSYRRVSREVFGMEPDTPYGYYLSSRQALVMNIKPGTGTLVHELVHPYMRTAWPDAPGWLNEGLASLFEYPYEDDGHLKGRINWRLPAVVAGFKAGTVPSFRTLTHLDTDAFYADPHGVNYAAARYLCYWLQELGVLSRVVRTAIARRHEDPTGLSALAEALGEAPDARWEEWRKFTLALSRGGS